MTDKPLSDTDILKIMNNRLNLVSFDQIAKYDNVDDLMKDGRCCILYESKPNFGHWTCIFKRDDGLHFFNSYGNLEGKTDGYPDAFLKYINANFRVTSHQNYPYLSELMLKSNYPLHYNNYVYQKLSKDIKTCGYWVCLRMRAEDMSDEEFHTFIVDNCKYHKMTPDELAVFFIKNF
jgi:hypothetical protein